MARAHFAATLLVFSLLSPGVLAQGNSGGNANSNSNSSSENRSSPPDRGSSNSSQPNDHAEEEALSAVQSGQAVPLSRIVGVLERTNGAEVLDAKLVKAGNVLLYRLKLLLPDGTVTTEFYHAPTGQPVDRP